MTRNNRIRKIILTIVLLFALTACGLFAQIELPGQGEDTRVTHVVQLGDSLASVAATYGVPMQAIIDANVDSYPAIAQPSATNRLQVGWRLVIPVSDRAVVAVAQLTAKPGDMEVVVMPLPDVTPTVGPAPDANGGYFDHEAALEIVRLTNEERAKQGLKLLAIDEGLMELACKRAVEMVTDYSHNGLKDDCGTCGENAIQGPQTTTAERLVVRWMNSGGHRENILRDGINRIGVGVYHSANNGTYAVQLFDY